MSFFQRVRSIVKTGLLWVLFWVPASLVLSASQFFTRYHGAWSLGYVLKLALVYGVTGFITGSAFGAVLTLTESRRSVGQLKGWRFTLWGAIAALVVPTAWWLFSPPNPWRFMHVGLFLFNTGVTALAGATSAAAMLKVARREDRLPPAPEPPRLTTSDAALHHGASEPARLQPN
jgi:hypothetical protein